ncbi:MAG: polysaccharide deacetylase family protein [Lewinellaceae bacterium]|nr:polysaccharide deacetylase family protein [Lewinellaceae bacterium]
MKRLLFKILRYSGLPLLFREIWQRRKVTILLFHDIDRATAEKTFDYLSSRYNIISLDRFVQACLRRDAGAIPEKAMILTFDDGHIGNYAIKPVVERLNIPVTIFLCAGIINTNRHYWFTWPHPGIGKSALKRMPNREKLRLLAESGFQVNREFDAPQAMSFEQINDLKGVIDLQAHTIFHPILPQCDDDEAHEEIVTAKKILERVLDLEITSIAYPNGDYCDRDIELAKEAGYRSGITVDFGFNTIDSDLFRLKRLSVNDTKNLDELAVKASGVWAFFKTRNGKKQDHGFMNRPYTGKPVAKHV